MIDAKDIAVFAGREWIPREYQKKSVEFVLDTPGAMLLHDPGLGKSSVMLAAFDEMRLPTAATMLVVAPLNVARTVWSGEVEKFAKTFGHLRVSVVCGDAKTRAERAEAEADIYVVNFENLIWLIQHWEKHNDGWLPDMLVVDESTRFKGAFKSTRFRFLKRYLPRFKRRYCLTGTPTPHSMLDMWAQAYICDLGNALGKHIGEYRANYFYQAGYGGYEWKISPGAEEKIYKALEPICERLDKLELLDLPELIEQEIRVQLPPTAMKQYVKMQAYCVAQMKEGKVIAANAAGATQKLRQMANGFVYGGVEEDERFVATLHTEKIKALEGLVEQLRDGALIVYEFRPEVAAIQKALPPGATSAVLGGGAGGVKTEKGVKDLIERWSRKEIDFLILHPDAAGHGLNLQDGGTHIIFFAQSWKLEGDKQTIARLWRDEKRDEHHTVIVHRIIADGTVDEDMLTALRKKDTQQRGLLDAMRERTEARGR